MKKSEKFMKKSDDCAILYENDFDLTILTFLFFDRGLRQFRD